MRPLVASAVSPLLLLLLFQGPPAEAYKSYQTKIPNGADVPDPCEADSIWEGVGHWLKGGTGERNPFGKAFAANGHVWNEAICKADSDQDGKTNGVELGDPNCAWKEDGVPQLKASGHPGICEPVNSEACKRLNGEKIPCGSASIKSTLGLLCAMLLSAFLLRL